MKKLFAILLIILVVAAIFTKRTLPGEGGSKPVLYWATDPNPARVEQIRVFNKWLERTHPEVIEKYGGIEIRVDAANSAPEKVLIQGISGVAPDLIDHCGGSRGRFNNSVGILEDLEEIGKANNFGVDKTYPAIVPEIQALVKVKKNGKVTYEPHQVSFPCNLYAELMYVNLDTFEKYGIDPPPERWTIDDFERLAKEFKEKANPKDENGNAQYRVFIAMDINARELARSMGGSLFNETQTAPRCHEKPMVDAYALKRKWVKEKYLPSAADKSSFATTSGYGGSGLPLFKEGNYAMVVGGRYLLIQFRKFNEELVAEGKPKLRMKVVELPHKIMPVSMTGTRSTAIYSGGKQKHLAKYFLEFLASRDYNMQVVEDADSLSPGPEFAKTEAFLRPEGHSDEWNLHEVFARTAQTIAIPSEGCPFVTESVVERLVNRAEENVLNDIYTPQEAMDVLKRGIEDEMSKYLKEDPDLLPFYEERCATQRKIEELRAKGEKVPISWITNPYHKFWYRFNGWADETK